MEVNSFCRGVLLGFLLSLLFAGTFCQADDKIVEVVGKGECADCKEKNIQTNHAFSGLRVTIDCKEKDGKFKRKGVGELDEEGKFKVTLSEEILDNGDDKEECYAQLHSAFSAPCPAHNGLEATKIVAKSDADGKQTFEPAENLKFSTELCTSATLWPHHKSHHKFHHKFPPLPEIDSWKHHFGHHFKFPPAFKKPEPKKPEPKPEPKKPEPKPEPKPPVVKPPLEKLPFPKKHCPPIPKIPKIHKIPTIPKIHKIPKIPKIPDIPKIPPKYHYHPKVPHFPPLPPHIPHA